MNFLRPWPKPLMPIAALAACGIVLGLAALLKAQVQVITGIVGEFTSSSRQSRYPALYSP
ncbi:MAG: hypothetical protein ACLR5Q_13370 [Coprococcus sp.]